ncbi:hypothetical protein D088_590040 [Salmonella enterica subsp. houtenae serovar 16:z4,z32:-- str. RKS3027]|nr:hypothetical protein D088_590040 [Salmonella enterica subsp. houtenae serovar 16:z4,z32:-- str. RKS3027]
MPLYNNTVYITSIIVRGIAVGFPSPANDYVERRLSVDDICQNELFDNTNIDRLRRC